jgi:hypothetical protein
MTSKRDRFNKVMAVAVNPRAYDKRNALEIRLANRHKRIAELRQRQMEQR